MDNTTSDRFQMTYRDFFIEVNNQTYMWTCYSPWVILRDETIDWLRRKIDDFIEKAY
jgi:hypothetical protein